MKHRIASLSLFVAIMLIGTHLVIADVSEFDDPELAELLGDLEESEEDFEGDIEISGFFDMEFNKLDTSNSTMKSLIRDEGTFSNSHLNIYFDSQVSPKFRFFSEVRLLHQPSTLFTEENLADRFQGSLLIERAWVDWNYRNQLNIQTIQTETQNAVTAMERGVKEVEAGTQLASQTGEALEEMAQQILTVTDMIRQVSTAAEEQTATTGEIASNIQQIASLTQQSADGAQQSVQSSLQLAELSTQLQQLVGQFKISENGRMADHALQNWSWYRLQRPPILRKTRKKVDQQTVRHS